MKQSILKVHPDDNIIVALKDFAAGEVVVYNNRSIQLLETIPTKHKFAEQDFAVGDTITMYGVTVGKSIRPIPEGTRISTDLSRIHISEPTRPERISYAVFCFKK